MLRLEACVDRSIEAEDTVDDNDTDTNAHLRAIGESKWIITD